MPRHTSANDKSLSTWLPAHVTTAKKPRLDCEISRKYQYSFKWHNTCKIHFLYHFYNFLKLCLFFQVLNALRCYPLWMVMRTVTTATNAARSARLGARWVVCETFCIYELWCYLLELDKHHNFYKISETSEKSWKNVSRRFFYFSGGF